MKPSYSGNNNSHSKLIKSGEQITLLQYTLSLRHNLSFPVTVALLLLLIILYVTLPRVGSPKAMWSSQTWNSSLELVVRLVVIAEYPHFDLILQELAPHIVLSDCHYLCCSQSGWLQEANIPYHRSIRIGNRKPRRKSIGTLVALWQSSMDSISLGGLSVLPFGTIWGHY